MGLFEYNFDSDTLRAIAHARLHILAGRGLESIIHSLARAELGTVSKTLKEPLELMQEGHAAEEILQAEAEKATNKAFREMLGALMLEGHAAIGRLDELSDEIQDEKKIKTEGYGDSLGSTLMIVAIIFMGTFIPIFLKILEKIPPNAMIPDIEFPPGFYSAYFMMLGAILTICFSSMRYRA